MKTNKKINYVYMLLIDYSTDDYEGIETYLFKNRKKAVKEMGKFIKSEKTSFWLETAFDKNGNLVNENYELDTNFEEDKNTNNNLWWNISKKDDSYLKTNIDLITKEIL